MPILSRTIIGILTGRPTVDAPLPGVWAVFGLCFSVAWYQPELILFYALEPFVF